MDFDLKSLIRFGKYLNIRKGALYKRILQGNNKCTFQLILPREYNERAIGGGYDQFGHIGKDRTLKLLRHTFHMTGMHDYLISSITNCPRV